MTPVKRVEIITNSVECGNLTDLIDRLGLPGYTVVPQTSGRGHRGERRADEMTGVFANSVVIVICEAAELPAFVEALRPFLKRTGGLCTVTDALSVRH